MTTQEFLNKLQRVRLKIKEDDTPLKLGSYSAIALQSERIFIQGRKTDGTVIGKYSTEDIWINPVKTPMPNKGGFSPLTGKTGNTAFKSNPDRKRKTSYFQGWKGLREAQGRPTVTMNLDFTGALRMDFTNPQGGFPSTRKVSNTLYVSSLRRSDSIVKREGAEDRFGVIFNLAASELAKFYEVVRFEFRKLITEG